MGTETMKEAIQYLAEGKELGSELARTTMLELMDGQCTPAQIGAFLMGLRLRGEGPEELTGMAQAMRERSVRIRPQVNGTLVDVCGTGGAPLKTFNISTVSAFVIAGAGVAVAKHGNRSNTSKSGSADVLEALGLNLEVSPEILEEAIEEIGIGFLFAPKFHPAMRHAIRPRRELGIRTVFNLLGPLTNPAGAEAHLMGVFHLELVEKFPAVLRSLGVKRAMVVHGIDGIDEISTLGPTCVGELNEEEIRNYEITPEEFGLKRTTIDKIANVQPQASARLTLEILKGKLRDERYEIVLLNSGAGIYVAGGAATIEDGLGKAQESIISGQALEKLLGLIEKSGASTKVRVR
ncbi:MAG: anthranilate phosphoribosyltransferase [Candidatus Bipolaricaulia bacterium]